MPFRIVNILSAILALAITLLVVSGQISWQFIFIVPGLWFLVVGFGSAFPCFNFYFKSICSLNTNKKQLVLSFDDGPGSSTTQILEILDKYSVKAYFFIVGVKAEKNPELVKTIIQKGHKIGNHSYSHSWFWAFYSSKKILHEIKNTNQIISALTGQPVKFFRPPFGVTNHNIGKAIKAEGQRSIGWSIRGLDGVKAASETIANRIIKSLKPGAIILLHDSNPNTAAALDLIIQEALKKSYSFTTDITE